MSDSLSKIYDDYEDYEILCSRKNINTLPLNPSGEWFKHFREMQIQLKLKDKKDENITRLNDRIN